jgi:hypothetical protein
MLHTMLTMALSSTTPATPAQTAVAWVEKLATTVRATSAKDLVPLATEIFGDNTHLSVTSEFILALRDHNAQSVSASTSKK